jgi:hypothetical protein
MNNLTGMSKYFYVKYLTELELLEDIRDRSKEIGVPLDVYITGRINVTESMIADYEKLNKNENGK